MAKNLTKIIPDLSGVYLFKNDAGEIIYIGKATSLKNRVRSYFAPDHPDWKVQSLIEEYADVDYILTKNEIEAGILEADLIQKHKPKYNVLLRDGQPFIYIHFTTDPLPTMEIVRNKKKGGNYFGPFLHKQQARKIHAFLERTFGLRICNKKIENGCLDYHIGLCPGTCRPDFKKSDYLFKLELAQDVLSQKDRLFTDRIKEKMQEYVATKEFEKAKHLRDYLDNASDIFNTLKIQYSDKKFATDIFVATARNPYLPEIKTDIAEKIQSLLKLPTPIKTIDCFDISHFQSRSIVGSCIRFANGLPEKHKFRKFKIETLDEQNDYAALQEIVTRRYRDGDVPDLVLIDGGKGQLNAVKEVFNQAPCISLAKREERLFCDAYPEGIVLDVKSDVGKLFIGLRDYAHHFAITYHRFRRHKEVK